MKRVFVCAAAVAIATSFPTPVFAGGSCHASELVVPRERGTLVRYTKLCTTPTVLEVPVGQKVLWRNEDGLAHTVTSGSGFWAGERLAGAGDTFSHTFKEEGTFPYYCMLHAEMGGVIQVGEAPKPIAVADSTRDPFSPADQALPWQALTSTAFLAGFAGVVLGRRSKKTYSTS